MGSTRIRWRNAARIGAGIAAVGGLTLVLPGLLEPPQPPPLPADIGLAAVPTQAAGPGERSPRRKPGRQRSRDSGGHDPEPRAGVHGEDHNPKRGREPKRDEPRIEEEDPAAPVPAAPPPAVPAPPAAQAQAFAPTSPTPPVAEPDPPDPVTPKPDPRPPAPQPAPPEFSFER